MGNVANLCGGDIMQQLIDKYGADAGKFFAAEKGKEAVEGKFGELTTKTKDIFTGFQTQTTGMVEKYNKDLCGSFDQVKNKATGMVPKGIPFLEKTSGQSFSDLTGFSTIQGQLTQVKNSAFDKIGSAKKEALYELDTKKGSIITQIDENKPKLPIYDSLPQPLKAKVLEQAQTKFGDVISSQKGALMNQITSQCDPNKYIAMFTSKLSPQGTLKNLVGGAPQKLMGSLKGIPGLEGISMPTMPSIGGFSF